MPPIRAAVYTRVSTDRQAAEGESLEMQEARAREVCEAHGWEMLPIYLDVLSGKKDKRPALVRLEKDLKAGAVDAVICYKVDRLGRSRRKLHEILELIQQRGIRLVSLTQQIDTSTATGRLMLSMLVDFAVFEVEQLGERVSDAMLHIAKSGRTPTGKAPWGYRYVPIDRETGEGGTLAILEPEAEGVRLAFDTYLRLGSLTAVGAALNRAGFRMPSGQPWTPEGVRRMLTTPTYGGEMALRRYRKGGKRISTPASIRAMREWEIVPANHEPIIPTEIAREVRERYWQSRSQSPRTETAGSPWAGLLVCVYCGSKMTRATHAGNRSAQFRCVNRFYDDCEGRAVSEAWLNMAALEAIDEAVKSARAIQEARQKRPAGKPVALAQKPNRERVLAALRRKLEKLEFRFDESIIDGDTYLRERKAIIAEIDAAQAESPQPVTPPRLTLPESLSAVWGVVLASPEGIAAGRRVLRALVSRILMDGEAGVIELNAIEGLSLPERVTVQRWPKGSLPPYKGWSRVAESCLGCQTTERRHQSSGYCTSCYSKRRREKARAKNP